jgi:hypothetical protein
MQDVSIALALRLMTGKRRPTADVTNKPLV